MSTRLSSAFVVLVLGFPVSATADVEISPLIIGTVFDRHINGVFDLVAGLGRTGASIGFNRYGTSERSDEARGIWELPLSEIPDDVCDLDAIIKFRSGHFTIGPNFDPTLVQNWEFYLGAGDGDITLSDAETTNLQETLQFSGESRIGQTLSFAVDSSVLKNLVTNDELYATLMIRSVSSVADKITKVAFDSVRLIVNFTTGCGTTSETYGGVEFPAGAVSFADRVIRYDPTFRGGSAPDETQQDARQILGVPDQGEMSLGHGGRIRLGFLDNSLSGSDDDRPDLYIFEIGTPESTFVEISKDDSRWFRVGTASGFASGIDIDQFGFNSNDRFSYVRITDVTGGGVIDFSTGADLVAVGARSSAPPVNKPPPFSYFIQAHVGGRSELIIQRNMLQWHHLKGPAPGLERQFWNPGKDSNSPTIIDSTHGPNITWVPIGWPTNLGNGTHPESHSSVFKGLTPVFPNDGRCWKATKQWGDGKVKIVQQPNSSNGFSLVVRFDDLIVGPRGGLHNLSGSGFYSIKLSRTFRIC